MEIKYKLSEVDYELKIDITEKNTIMFSLYIHKVADHLEGRYDYFEIKYFKNSDEKLFLALRMDTHFSNILCIKNVNDIDEILNFFNISKSELIGKFQMLEKIYDFKRINKGK